MSDAVHPLEFLIVRKPYEFDRDLIRQLLMTSGVTVSDNELAEFLDGPAVDWRQLVFDSESELILMLWWQQDWPEQSGWRWVHSSRDGKSSAALLKDLAEVWQRQLPAERIKQLMEIIN